MTNEEVEIQLINRPRFRGIAYESEQNKWSWVLLVTLMGKGDDGIEFHSNEFFDNKKNALESLNSTVHKMIKDISEKFPEIGISSNEYIDMKTNLTRRFDKGNEH